MEQKWVIINQIELNDTKFKIVSTYTDDVEGELEEYLVDIEGEAMAIQIEDIVRFLLCELPRRDHALNNSETYPNTLEELI